MRELGRYVRARRVEKGLTQQELGAAAGVTHSAISKIERAEQSGVDFVLLQNLSTALGEETEHLEALLRGRARPRSAAPTPEPSREIAAFHVGQIAGGPLGRSRIDHWEYVPVSLTRGRIMRAAIVDGDCMADEIRAGDTVLFDENCDPHDGAIVVAVLLDEGPDERGKGVIKRFYRLNGKVKLAPNVGEPIILPADRVRIEGVVIEVRHRYDA